MANSIVQNQRGATKDAYRKLKAAQAFGGTPVGSSRELGQLFENPLLGRVPTYTFDALTDDAVAFIVWDSDDPLDNANAEVNGEASPKLLFPANTLTPVRAHVLVANDDTVGMIAIQALVLGSATAPTLVPAFENTYTLKGTFTGGNIAVIAAETTPGFSATAAEVATGRTTIALPADAKAITIASSIDVVAGVVTGGVFTLPNTVVTATGAGEIRQYDLDTPALTEPPDTSILHVQARVREPNGHLFRHTQDSADTAGTLFRFGINTGSTPDSLKLEVTGLASAELRWSGGIWIGESLPIAFRAQV
jgi:hypothetical protein